MMDLFSQTLSLGLTTATTAFIFGSIVLIKKSRRKLSRFWIIAIGFGTAALFSFGLWLTFSLLYSQDQIPYSGMLWALPLGLSLYLVAISFTSMKRLVLASLATVCATVMLLVIINNYYHYYPTLVAVFQSDKPIQQDSNNANQNSNSEKVVLEQYYQALPGQSLQGQLLPLNIPSSTSSFSPREGRIYLPAALRGNDQIRLPVIVLLAGYPGSPVQWEQSGILAIMNDFAALHKGLAPIVAAVDFTGTKDADTECVDSNQGSAETYLTKDVPNYIKQHYQVQTDASSWAIGGYSAGGTCGPLIALRNPSVYQNFMNVSGDAAPSIGNDVKTLSVLFNGSQQQLLEHTPNYLLKKGNPLYANLHGWYFYGKQDNPLLNRRLQDQYNLAKQAGLTVEIQSIDGHHEFGVWKAGYVMGLPWISYKMNLTTYDKK
jgi:S-formylglutathione hydrolase FrmB